MDWGARFHTDRGIEMTLVHPSIVAWSDHEQITSDVIQCKPHPCRASSVDGTGPGLRETVSRTGPSANSSRRRLRQSGHFESSCHVQILWAPTAASMFLKAILSAEWMSPAPRWVSRWSGCAVGNASRALVARAPARLARCARGLRTRNSWRLSPWGQIVSST